MTFDVTAAGIVPLARSHMQLAAGGLSVFLEADLGPEANIVSAIPPASFAGVSLTVLPWLLAGGTLTLHHGGDPGVLAAQCEALGDGTLMLPGPALGPLVEARRLGAGGKTVVALWRAPERLATSPAWHGDAALIDIASFGELAVLPVRRDADGLAMPIPYGAVSAPPTAAGAVTVAETARTRSGTLALRGPMVPTKHFPPGAGEDAKPDGYLDTGFTCRIERGALVVTGPPGGMTAVGGYRFLKSALETELATIDPAATLLALPHGLLGQRLAGSAPDRQAIVAALEARGFNPLLALAFRPHPAADAA